MSVAIIVPYRERENHLQRFLSEFDTECLSNCQIVIVEQCDSKEFNRGKLLNIGFQEMKEECDYVIFHDVDMIPSKEYIIKAYAFEEEIVRLSIVHGHSLGRCCKVKKETYEKMNGHPNTIWGWGLEDRILWYRANAIDAKIKDFNECKKHYKTLPHKSNAHPYTGEKKERDVFETRLHLNHNKAEKIKHAFNDGLNTLEYKLLSKERSGKNESIVNIRVEL